MKKLAYATLVVLSAGAGSLLLATPLDAKGGSGGGGHGFSARASFRPIVRPNIGPLARRGHPIPRNIGPLAGRHLAFQHRHHGHHHHRNHDGYGYGEYAYSDYGYTDYGYSDYGYSAYPDLPESVSDYAPPPPPRIAHPVIRTVENSKDVCAADSVKVPATGGGETTVTILRCY